MKTTIIRTLAIIALTISTASAIELGDFLGSWRGKRRETVNGVGYSSNTTYKITRHSDGGLLLVTKTDTPMWGMVTGREVFYKNGKYTARDTTDYGFILASGSGTWKKSDGDILISIKGGSVSGSKKASGRLKLIDRKHFRYTGASGVVKIVLTATRV